MVQISLVIKLFLLVFIEAALWLKGLCVVLQSAEVLE